MALATNDEEALTLDDIELQFKKQMGHEPHKAQQMLSFCRQNNFDFKYKHIKKWWARKEEAIEMRKKYNTDPDCDAWKVGTYVMIYSRSKKQWFSGKIEREIDDEMLVVKYKKTTKRIQRSNKNLKPFPDNHPLLFIVGTKCKIYDTNKWSTGEITKIYNDDEGEWLKIKYKGRFCDIQRYSKDLMANNDLNGKWCDDIKTIESCDTENIVFCLRNNVFIDEEFNTDIFEDIQEKIVGYFYKNNINGKYIKNINIDVFIEDLCQFLEAKQSNKKLQNLFKKMLTLLIEKINEMFVNNDKINGENEGKSDSDDDEEQNEGHNGSNNDENNDEEREEENDVNNDEEREEEENDAEENDVEENDVEENDVKENES